jgi:hypothetical protein
VRRGEKDASRSPSKGHKTLKPSIDHPNIGTFHWPPNIETFHWPPSMGFSSPSFSRCEFGSFWSLFFNIIFELNLENLFLQFVLGGEELLVLVDGGKKGKRLNDSSIFERMEMSIGSFGSFRS